MPLGLGPGSTEPVEPVTYGDSSRFFYGKKDMEDFHSVSWRPTVPSQVMFHGSPAEEYDNGHMNSRSFAILDAEIYDALTTVEGKRKIYLPKHPEGDIYGDSYCTVAKNSGVGLFSHTGENIRGNAAFMQVKRNYSSSPGNFSLYMRFPSEDVRPWSDGKTLECRAGQEVGVAYLSNPEEQQLQQKMAFVMTNGTDRVEFSCNTVLYGKNDGKTKANIWRDPDQGNHLVIGGPCRTHEGWISLGANVHRGDRGLKKHKIQVPWENFEKILTDRGMNPGQPEDWRLKQARFGQEIYNLNYLQNSVASIGSRLQYFRITGV